MSNVRSDKLLRIACGLGLLLLLAAHEKLCPPPSAAPAKPNHPGDSDPPRRPTPNEPRRTDRKKKARKPPLPLASLLPDTAVPRWPAAWDEARPHRVSGWHDGIVSRGQRNPTRNTPPGSPAADLDRWAWHRFLTPTEPLCPGSLLAASLPTADPAVRTVIARTGPPQS